MTSEGDQLLSVRLGMAVVLTVLVGVVIMHGRVSVVHQPLFPVANPVTLKQEVTEAQREAATKHLAQAVESAAEHPIPFDQSRSPVGVPREFVALFVKENGERFLVIDYRTPEAPEVQGTINGTWIRTYHLTHIEVIPQQEAPPGGWRDF